MSARTINILARVPFIDRSKPGAPVDMVAITFQLAAPDNRVNTVDIPAADAGKPTEDQAIAAKIKSMGESKQEQKTINI